MILRRTPLPSAYFGLVPGRLPAKNEYAKRFYCLAIWLKYGNLAYLVTYLKNVKENYGEACLG